MRNSGTGVSLSKSVAIPYADYKKAANQFRTTLALPTSSEAVATLNVRTIIKTQVLCLDFYYAYTIYSVR